MTKVELQEEFARKCKLAGFSNVRVLVRNYSTSKASLEKAIEKVDKVLERLEEDKHETIK